MLASHVAPLLFGMASLTLTDVFVDGSDANCSTGIGTAADPVCTIGAALAIAGSGDTIRIAPGTYAEHVVLGFDVELVGTDGAEVTIIDGEGSGGSVVHLLQNTTVVLEGLTVTGGLAASGGGIYSRGNLTLRDSVVSGNEARAVVASGGGIASKQAGASLTILNSTISGNSSIGNSYSSRGGGIVVVLGSLTVRDSTIKENMVRNEGEPTGNGTGGGGIQMASATLVMSGSTVSGNDGHREGGGINVLNSTLNISNSTFSGNLAIRGPALASFQASATPWHLSNVTIANHALPIHTFSQPIEFQNCIIGNDQGGGPAIVGGDFTSLGHNLFGITDSATITAATGDLFGTAGAEIFPLLGPLQDNGGPTHTHALLPGSPAIDAGNPVMFESVDQRGLLRPLGNAPDIGSFELEVFSSLCNGDGGNGMGCTDCPCMNNAAPGTFGGCLNSAGASTQIAATGDPSASLPPGVTTDLRFRLSGAPAGALCVMLSGDAVASQTMGNMCFGLDSGNQSIDRDGLRCAVLNTKRHGARTASAMGEVLDSAGPSRVWGGEAQPNGGLWRQGGFVAGQTRYFQVTYREDSLAGCMRGLNTSQAVEVVFTP